MCIVSILTHFFFGCLLILYDDFFWIVVLNFNIVQFRNTFLYDSVFVSCFKTSLRTLQVRDVFSYIIF